MHSLARCCLLACALLCLQSAVVSSACPYAAGSANSKAAAPDYRQFNAMNLAWDGKMQYLNDHNHKSYVARKTQVVDELLQQGLISVLVVSDHLELYSNSTLLDTTSLIASDPFNTDAEYLKRFCHLPLTLSTLLQPALTVDRDAEVYDLDDTTVEQLRGFVTALESVFMDFSTITLHWPADRSVFGDDNISLRSPVQSIAGRTAKYAGGLVDSRQLNRTELRGYAQSVLPQLLEAVDIAARSTLLNVHHTLERWHDTHMLTDDMYSKLYVVVNGGSHMAATDNIYTQYFQRLMQIKCSKCVKDDIRVIYNTADDMLDNGFDSLATHIMDAEVSQLFFGDRKRLHRDVMADAAAKVVDELLPLPTSDSRALTSSSFYEQLRRPSRSDADPADDDHHDDDGFSWGGLMKRIVLGVAIAFSVVFMSFFTWRMYSDQMAIAKEESAWAERQEQAQQAAAERAAAAIWAREAAEDERVPSSAPTVAPTSYVSSSSSSIANIDIRQPLLSAPAPRT